MAPEQLRDARTVDARADIWGMGVALYELLTGRLPFPAENVADLFVAILESEPVPIQSLRKDAPPALDGVVRRCLTREPDDRFPDVAAFAEALVPFGPPGSDGAAQRIRHTMQSAAGASARGARSTQSRGRRARRVAALVATASLLAVAAAGLASELIPAPSGASEHSQPSATGRAP
jgi:serine/threonine-protein kinase